MNFTARTGTILGVIIFLAVLPAILVSLYIVATIAQKKIDEGTSSNPLLAALLR